LLGFGTGLLTAGLAIGLLTLSPWLRPISPVTCSAQRLLGRQGKAQEQRISTGLNVAFGCSLLVFVATIGVA
jgi:hypothetical protein